MCRGSDMSQYIRFEHNYVTKFRVCNRSNDNIHVDKFSDVSASVAFL